MKKIFMKRMKKPTVAVIAMVSILLPSFYRAAGDPTGPEPVDGTSEYSLDHYRNLGQGYAADFTALAEHASFGGWEGKEGRGLIVTPELAAAMHFAEMKSLGLEPREDAIKKILDSKIIHVVLYEPSDIVDPRCPDQAYIEFNDGTRWQAMSLYCDPYAQADGNFTENRTYWHRILMEFPGALSKDPSGRINLVKGFERYEHPFDLTMPQARVSADYLSGAASESVHAAWEKIQAAYPDMAGKVKGIEVVPLETLGGHIDFKDGKIILSERVLYSLGRNECAIAALLLDCMAFVDSGKAPKLDRLGKFEAAMIASGVVTGIGGGVYAVERYDLGDSDSAADGVIMLSMLAGLGVGIILASPFIMAEGKIIDQLEQEFTQATPERLVELGYDPWGYLVALDLLERYRQGENKFMPAFWHSYAEHRRIDSLMGKLSEERFPTEYYWEKTGISPENAARDISRLIIIREHSRNYSARGQPKDDPFSPYELEAELEASSPDQDPYVLARHNHKLRWLNNENWRRAMKARKGPD